MGDHVRLPRWFGPLLMVIGGGFIVAGLLAQLQPVGLGEAAPPTMTPTPEPIVPTRTVAPQPTATVQTGEGVNSVVTATPVDTVTESAGQAHKLEADPTVEATLTATAVPTTVIVVAAAADTTATLMPAEVELSSGSGLVVPAAEQFRIGVSIPHGSPRDYDLRALGVSWIMNWQVSASPDVPPGVDYAQTVRMHGGALTPDAATLTRVAASRPGALWLISNEPDVRWQDNVPPEVYARLHHEAYQAIRAGDPTAIIAAGGIAQPTELRLRYLDLALQAHREMYGTPLPADAWHIHNYMLREERDSWGVDIPPGLPDDVGAQFSIADSGDIEQFKAQLYAFRRWMVSRDYAGQSLIVSEFGIPMPEDYGFPPETVGTFLEETWRFFLSASNPTLGDPHDGGRLVQMWCWFS
ncbi:MAG: hypothetical protein ACP5HG_13155, partial [Anaerolineae bacterium]